MSSIHGRLSRLERKNRPAPKPRQILVCIDYGDYVEFEGRKITRAEWDAMHPNAQKIVIRYENQEAETSGEAQ